jgi:trehalose 6-phosphate phosphatase
MGLPVASTEPGRTALAAIVADPAGALIGLDFDGTLSPIVPDPEQSRAHPDIPPVLERLAGLGPRLAVVTGRPAATAVEYGGLAGVPGLVVLGHYGLERWEDGTVSAPDLVAGVEAARRQLPALLAELGAPEGTHVEDKGRAVAVHTRRTADPQGAFDLLRAPLDRLADETGLVVEPGRMVLELRPAGGDKGDAVRALVEEMGPGVVVFVGDDLGDLPAFAEVARLRDEGLPGLLVCSGSTEVTALAERADLVVDGPEGVAALLTALADEISAA